MKLFFIPSTYVCTVLPLTAFSSVALIVPFAFTFRSYVLFLLLLAVLSSIVTLLSLEFNVTLSNLFVISVLVAKLFFSLLYVSESNFLPNSSSNCFLLIASASSVPFSSPVIFLLTVILSSFNVILALLSPDVIDVIPVNLSFKLNLTTPSFATSAVVLVPLLKLNPFVNVVSCLVPVFAAYFIFWSPNDFSVTIGDASLFRASVNVALPLSSIPNFATLSGVAFLVILIPSLVISVLSLSNSPNVTLSNLGSFLRPISTPVLPVPLSCVTKVSTFSEV